MAFVRQTELCFVVAALAGVGWSLDQRDLAGSAVHADALAGLDAAGRRPGPGDGRQTVFATDDRGMRHHAADISDGCAYLAEHRSPARRDDRRDQDFPLL